MKKIIIGVVVLAIILGIVFWRFGFSFLPFLNNNNPENQQITLNMWGLWEDESLLKPAIDAYLAKNSNVKIIYTKNNSNNYRTRVQTQILQGESGPDIFMIHNSWIPMFIKSNALVTLPESIMSLQNFNTTFYPIAQETLVRNNQIYALPVEIDGLALYYNEDLLSQAGVVVPKTWDEFTQAAIALTEKDPLTGKINIAGAAMGATGNVDHFSDIIGLLYLQQRGANLEQPATDAGADVIRFYTDFIRNPNKKVWDLGFEPSTQAFYSGKLAFYFAPSWRAHELRAANSELKFKTAPVPHLPGRDINWATFWAFSVSAKSTRQEEAWKFLQFLTSAEAEKLMYQEAANIRLFGQPYSRVDLGKEIENDPVAGSIILQAPNYKSWYLSSNTFDQGLNDEMIKYFEDAINATLQGSDPKRALETTALGVQQTLDKYVVVGSVSPLPASE